METENYYVCSVEDTKKYGIICASIIGRVRMWCEYNEKNKVKDRFYKGEWWSGFMSARSFSEQIGIKQRTIEKKLTQLVEDNVLIKDCFNKKGFDRTGWYRVNPDTPIAYSIYADSVDDIPLERRCIYPNSVDPSTPTEETIPVSLTVKQSVSHSVSQTVNTSVNQELLINSLENNNKVPIDIKDIAIALILKQITSKQIDKLKENKHHFIPIKAIHSYLNEIGITF